MQIRNGRRVMERALVLCAMGTITACATSSRPSEGLNVVYPLVVNNRSDFEVVVYAMASPTTRGARLGTARPLGTSLLRIPAYALHGGDVFSVELHAIGAVRSVPNWVSGGLRLDQGLMAQLDVVGDMSGNLRLSNLSARAINTLPVKKNP